MLQPFEEDYWSSMFAISQEILKKIDRQKEVFAIPYSKALQA